MLQRPIFIPPIEKYESSYSKENSPHVSYQMNAFNGVLISLIRASMRLYVLKRLEEARVSLFSQWTSAVLAWNREETHSLQPPTTAFWNNLLVRFHTSWTSHEISGIS